LLSIANKLLGRQNLNFDQLTPPEQKLWNLFEKSDIYEFLTGEKDTVPEFRHSYVGFTAKPKVNIDIPIFCQNLVHYHPALPEILQAIQRAHSAPSPLSHNLCEHKQKINYWALHLAQEIQQVTQDLKQKCKGLQKSIRKLAKAAMTKLALWAFSQSSKALLLLLHHRSLRLLCPGTSGPQNERGQSSARSETDRIPNISNLRNYNSTSGLPENTLP
jgi:hypothetical protein